MPQSCHMFRSKSLQKNSMYTIIMMITSLLVLSPTVLSCGQRCIHSAGLGSIWSRGDYGVLSFSQGCQNYTWTFGSTTMVAAGNLTNVTSCTQSSGTDSHGVYDELVLHVGLDGEMLVKYYSRLDAFVFTRIPKSHYLPRSWPSFSTDGFPVGPDDLKLRCIGWGEHYFFPGSVLPRTAHTHPSPFSLNQCSSGGPLFVFGVDTEVGNAFALSALDNFTVQGVDQFSVSVGKGGCGERCTMFASSAILMGRPGLVRATRAFGSVIRQWHQTKRMRGAGVSQLSYWNDNQAGYSWWTVGPDQEVWGKPEDIYLKLKSEYDKAGVPIRGWEPDNNWLVDYTGGNEWGNGTGTAKNWIGRQWDYNQELYPSGGADFVSKLGNISMTYYTNGFGPNNVYRNVSKYKMQKNNEPHPNTSYIMYNDLLSAARSKYNMEMLFTDFLCYRQPEMEQHQDVPDGEEGGHLWLGGQARAAADNGIEVQWCMALAHQVLESLQFPAVTNTRVNGDGGLDVEALVVPALLAATVGLGWSKDNLRTADRCYVDALYPNGTIKWPCGSINKGEGTSGSFKMQTQQTILATLSLGPVGISDQLSSYPTNESATITSNIPLVLATCAATGDLLQPSYPLTPLERSLSGSLGSESAQLWGTYTAVPTVNGSVNVWFISFAFSIGKGATSQVSIEEADLAPMVDASSLPSSSFSDIPQASFNGTGARFPSGTSGWVSWKGDFISQGTNACAAVNISEFFVRCNVSLTMTDGDAIMNIAPLLLPHRTFLGESGKISAISTYRFTSVSADNSRQSITVTLRGKVGELVTLLFAIRQDASSPFLCRSEIATIGSDGTTSVTFSG